MCGLQGKKNPHGPFFAIYPVQHSVLRTKFLALVQHRPYSCQVLSTGFGLSVVSAANSLSEDRKRHRLVVSAGGSC